MAGSGASPGPVPPQAQVARLMDGFLATQALYVAAKLGIADVLADGPQSAEAVAWAVGAHPDLLGRVLRGLVLEDVLAEDEDGRFALTPLGACLRDGVPGSLRGPVIARGELYYRAAEGLLRTVQRGGTAFEHVHGERFFDHLSRHPGREAAFQASMASRSEHEAADVVAAYDFSGIGRLVDVGGGGGILLGAILRANPGLRGVLLDRPEAIRQARERLAADGVADRYECVEGDFFASVPGGADAYLLSRVIHDWDDADARRLLAVCRAAIPPGARLLIVEALLPERARDRPAAIRMDLHMLVLLGARERTERQYRRLLADTGFEVRRVLPTPSPTGVSVIEAAPIRPT
jgi:O-methyltransferase domain/Dimerisation domain